MGATYFNFSNVIREVEGQLQSNLSQSNTLEQFKLLSLKTAVEIQDKKVNNIESNALLIIVNRKMSKKKRRRDFYRQLD